MTRPVVHGSILCGVVATPDLDGALADYRDRLGLQQVEAGTVPHDLASSWAAPAAAGARQALLRPTSGAPAFLRLVETPRTEGFRPTTTYGWASFELTVQDVFGWPQRLAGSGFDIIGPPAEIEGLPYFVAMQMLGRGGEMIYLNEVALNTPTSDLPKARSPVDHIFIAILAARDRQESIAWYRERLGLEEADTYTIAYDMINAAFGLPADRLSTITMVQNGRLPLIEIDDYPAKATERVASPGQLPPGNALVTLAVTALDALDLSFLMPPVRRGGPLYADRRVATVRGAAGELVELVEIG